MGHKPQPRPEDWPKCAVVDCENGVCLWAVGGKCWPHTFGHIPGLCSAERCVCGSGTDPGQVPPQQRELN